MKKYQATLVCILSVLSLSGCGGSSEQAVEALLQTQVAVIDINNSHNQFGFIDTKSNQIDTDGSIHANPFYNGSGEGYTEIDFSKNDMMLHSLEGTSSDWKRYYFIKIEEYGSYVKVLSEEWLSMSGGSEVIVPSYGSWAAMPKYDKPIMYGEQILHVYYSYNNDVPMEPVKHEAMQGEAIAAEVLFEGSKEVQGRIGKHYELVRNKERLAVLFERVGIDAERADTVDFSSHSVIALFMGSVDTPLATIGLTKLNFLLWPDGQQSIFKRAEIQNAIAARSCTSEKRYLPYQFVSIPATSGDIAFVDAVSAVGCR